MKKIYFAAIAAVAALGANAQYNVENVYMDATVTDGKQIYDIVVADQGCLDALAAAGKTVNDIRVNDETNHLYIWPGGETFSAGDSSYPGVGFSSMQFDGYVALVVTGFQGWSGAGFLIEGANLSHWNENTRVHIAYMSPATAPESVAFIINDQNGQNTPAKVAVGAPFSDNGAIYPAVGTVAADDWKAIDMSFSDIKKIYPTFDWQTGDTYAGNVISFLAGGVEGRTISLDAIYFYTPAGGDDAVEGVAADAALVVTANTINSNVAGIVVYDLEGRIVKSAEGSILGIADLNAGAYIAKSGAKAVKFVK